MLDVGLLGLHGLAKPWRQWLREGLSRVEVGFGSVAVGATGFVSVPSQGGWALLLPLGVPQ